MMLFVIPDRLYTAFNKQKTNDKNVWTILLITEVHNAFLIVLELAAS